MRLRRCPVLVEEGGIIPAWSAESGTAVVVARRHVTFRVPSETDGDDLLLRAEFPLRRTPDSGKTDAWMLYGLPFRKLTIRLDGMICRIPLTYEERFRLLLS